MIPYRYLVGSLIAVQFYLTARLWNTVFIERATIESSLVAHEFEKKFKGATDLESAIREFPNRIERNLNWQGFSEGHLPETIEHQFSELGNLKFFYYSRIGGRLETAVEKLKNAEKEVEENKRTRNIIGMGMSDAETPEIERKIDAGYDFSKYTLKAMRDEFSEHVQETKDVILGIEKAVNRTASGKPKLFDDFKESLEGLKKGQGELAELRDTVDRNVKSLNEFIGSREFKTIIDLAKVDEESLVGLKRKKIRSLYVFDLAIPTLASVVSIIWSSRSLLLNS